MARKPAGSRLDPMGTTVSAAEGLIDIEQTRESLHAAARVKLGVTGDEKTETFRTILHANGLSSYPIIALGLLYISDNFQAFAFGVLTPEISRTLGISIGAIGAAIGLRALSVAAAPLPIAALTQGRARRVEPGRPRCLGTIAPRCTAPPCPHRAPPRGRCRARRRAGHLAVGRHAGAAETRALRGP